MPSFVKPNTLKDAFKTTHKIRSTDDAVQKLVTAFNDVIALVLAEAVKSAQAARRTTVLEEDATAALEKHLAKRRLTWDETAQEILDQTAADLGKISKTIQDYISGGHGFRASALQPFPRLPRLGQKSLHRK
jgi:histone H3/H4